MYNCITTNNFNFILHTRHFVIYKVCPIAHNFSICGKLHTCNRYLYISTMVENIFPLKFEFH